MFAAIVRLPLRDDAKAVPVAQYEHIMREAKRPVRQFLRRGTPRPGFDQCKQRPGELPGHGERLAVRADGFDDKLLARRLGRMIG